MFLYFTKMDTLTCGLHVILSASSNPEIFRYLLLSLSILRFFLIYALCSFIGMLIMWKLFISHCSRSSPKSDCKNSKSCNLRYKWVNSSNAQASSRLQSSLPSGFLLLHLDMCFFLSLFSLPETKVCIWILQTSKPLVSIGSQFFFPRLLAIVWSWKPTFLCLLPYCQLLALATSLYSSESIELLDFRLILLFLLLASALWVHEASL